MPPAPRSRRRSLVILLQSNSSAGADNRAAVIRAWTRVTEQENFNLIPASATTLTWLLRHLSTAEIDRARCFVAAIGLEATQTLRNLTRTSEKLQAIHLASACAIWDGKNTSAQTRVLPGGVPLHLLTGDPASPSVIRAALTFFHANPARATLTVRVDGLRSARGNIVAALFAGPTGFPDDGKRAIADVTVAVPSGSTTAEATFHSLLPGDYAVSLFHDENGDGKFGMSFGFPVEGFGTSNDPKVQRRAPTWGEATFTLTGEEAAQTVRVRMRYLSLL